MAAEALWELQGRAIRAALWRELLQGSASVLGPAACRVGAVGEASGGVRVRGCAYLNIPRSSQGCN